MFRKNKSILIVGGDLRQVHLANLFSKYIKVYVYGFSDEIEFNENIKRIENIKNIEILFDYVVLPMPALKDNNLISTPLCDYEVKIQEVLKKCDEETQFFGGKISDELAKILEKNDIKYYDYLDREELAILNAVPTAEGTLQIILNELPITIYGMNVLIIGSGRISKVLRKNLVSLGANVVVSARKCSDLAWAKIDGCDTSKIKDMADNFGKYDVIINTVPVTILTHTQLKLVKKETLIIDLASKPGGIDFDEAKKMGLKVIWALSLPGKIAPISAGEIIFDTIINILDEMGDCIE